MKYLLAAVLLLLAPFVYAGEYGCDYESRGGCGVTNITNVTNTYHVGVSDDDLQEAVAMGVAMSSLQFDFSDSAVQVGVGGGFYRSENALAIGAAKRLGESTLVNASVTQTGSHNATGVGVTFRF